MLATGVCGPQRVVKEYPFIGISGMRMPSLRASRVDSTPAHTTSCRERKRRPSRVVSVIASGSRTRSSISVSKHACTP